MFMIQYDIMKLLVIFLLTLSLSGCVESDKISNDSAIPEYPQVVELAKKDLAQRLNISIEEVRLVKQEKVDWHDTSLGFPEEGKMYAQVITPGFRIILKANDKLYEYHSDYKQVVGPKEVSY